MKRVVDGRGFSQLMIVEETLQNFSTLCETKLDFVTLVISDLLALHRSTILRPGSAEEVSCVFSLDRPLEERFRVELSTTITRS